MADLNFEVATNLAGSLVTIGHPFSQAAIQATALDLMRWCKGVIIGGRVIGPQQQAGELVEAARNTWEAGWPEKGGTRQLLALYRQLFEPVAEFRTYETPRELDCATCSDTGWEIVERNGISGAQPCSACGARKAKPEPALCPKCSGKGTILSADNRRVFCSCVPAAERGKGFEVIKTMLLQEAS